MPKTITVAEFLSHAIELSGKTQREIAQEVGYERPNVLSMMKQGITKVPIEKIPALSKACNVDPIQFLRIAMNEYHFSMWMTLSRTLGETISEDERQVLDAYRASRAEAINPQAPSQSALIEFFANN